MAHLTIDLQVGPKAVRILTILFPDGEEFDKLLSRIQDTLLEEKILEMLKQDPHLAEVL